MSNQFLKLRRSAVPGKVPTTESIDYGEIALNIYDGVAYMKKSGSNGIEVVTIGSNSGSFTGSFLGNLIGTSSWATNSITASYLINAKEFYYTGSAPSGSHITTGSTWIDSDDGYFYVYIDDGVDKYWIQPTVEGVQGPQGPSGSQGPTGPQGPSGSSQPFSFVSGNTWNTTSSLEVSGSFLVSGSSTFTNIGPTIFSGSVDVNLDTYALNIGSGSYKNLEIQNINNTGSIVVRNGLYISGAPSGSVLSGPYLSGSEKFPQLTIEAVYPSEPASRFQIKAGGYGSNTWFGFEAMQNVVRPGTQNDAFGFRALQNLTTGFNNTAFGGWALGDTTTGNRNTAVGLDALWRNVSGSRNVGIGSNAGQDNVSGSRNIYIGSDAGRGILSGSNNIIIGTITGLPAGLSDNIIISTGNAVTKARSFETGNWLFQNGGAFIDGGFRLDINGSARFGASNQMTVQSTGQVDIKNGLTVTGSLVAPNITGSLFGTASWALNAISASYILNAVSASHAVTASYYDEKDPVFVGISGSLATTGSNIFNGNQTIVGNQTITGSLTITSNLTVLGSASITYVSESTLNIGTNLITVNTLNPSIRFGGLAVIDSGSSPLQSGSFLFDSQKDQFIFVHQTSPITSSVFLLGPETYNNLGNEGYLTQNRIPKGTGIEHLNDSNISDNGSVVSINSNTQVTGSLTVSQPIVASLAGTASWASNAVTSSYILNAVSSSFSATASYVNPLVQDVILTGSLNTNNAVNINNTVAFNPSRVNVYKNGNVIAQLGSAGTGGSDIVGGLILWNNGLGTGSSGNVVISAAGDSYIASPTSTFSIGTASPTPGYILNVNGASNFRSGASVTGSLIAPNITGSLEGTASWARNADTASYASVLNISSSLYTSQRATGSAATTTNIVSLSTGSYTAAFFDYTVASGSNSRAGTVMSVWNGASVQYTDNSTLDIGNTNDITMSAALSGGNIQFRSTTTAFQWIVKTTYRLI